MKRFVSIITIAVFLFMFNAIAEVPDISGLTMDELLELQSAVNEAIADNATYTMLPGIYDCNHDFNYLWYNAKVMPADDGTVRTATIKLCVVTASNPPEYEYEITSNDEGFRIPSMENDAKQWFMIVEGATLEVTPCNGF